MLIKNNLTMNLRLVIKEVNLKLYRYKFMKDNFVLCEEE